MTPERKEEIRTLIASIEPGKWPFSEGTKRLKVYEAAQELTAALAEADERANSARSEGIEEAITLLKRTKSNGRGSDVYINALCSLRDGQVAVKQETDGED